jgi:hypothetical protein
LVENIVILLLIAGVIYIFAKGGKKLPSELKELICYKNISNDGIIELDGGRYRMVLEVEPINMGLRSPNEQKAVWLSFRSVISSLTVKATFLIQSQYLNLSDYIKQQKELAANAPTPELAEMGMKIAGFYKKSFEETAQRDRKHYIVLKYDGEASGMKILSKRPLPGEHEKIAARQELEDNKNIVMALLGNVGIKVTQLDMMGVLQMIHQTFNRSLANMQQVEKADKYEVFNLTSRSMTPFIGGDENAA